MKKNILILTFALLPLFAVAQIPNPDFEQWQVINRDLPKQWGVYGITKRVTGYNSQYAARLERDMNNPNSPGAVIYGNPDNDFSGGVPFADRPDSVAMFVKRHLPVGDSAWFLVMMRRNGQAICMNNFKFGGSDSTRFVRMSFAIPYSDTGLADTLIIGVSSTDPDNQFIGSFVVVDSIHFIGGNGAVVPNSNFEMWESITLEEPVGWQTTNQNLQVSSTSKMVSKTSDAAFHQYAAKIQNVLNSGEYRQGYLMAGRQGDDGPLPGFALSGKDSVLYAQYKCFPSGGDKVNIGIFVFDSGAMVGSGFLRQEFTISSWSQTAIPIDYYFGYNGTPDSAVIYCSAFDGGEDAKGASILYVDALRFNEPFTSIETAGEVLGLLTIYPNPAKDKLKVLTPMIGNAPIHFSIIDANGKTVRIMTITETENGLNHLEIDLSELDNGVYYIRLENGGLYSSKPFIVNH